MSTRSKKSSASKKETSQTTSTPVASPSTSFSSPRNRPPSPTMVGRVQEKAELANLNDRLAAYIDRVRSLQNENQRLTKQIQTQEETVHRETSNIKTLYEAELADARKLLDDTAKEKAKLQLDVTKYKGDYEDLKEKHNQQSRDFTSTQKRLLTAESQINDLQARLNDAVSQRKHYEDEYNKLKKDYDNVVKQLAAAKKQLEAEMVSRVDLENRLQSLKEDIQFKSQIHEQELNETVSRTRVEIEEVDGKLHDEYESKLTDALKSMRQQNDETIRSTREETEEVFEKKLGDLRKLAERNDSLVSTSQDEVNTYRKRVNDMSSELNRLRSQAAANEARIKDLEDNLAQEQAAHKTAVTSRDVEINRLRDALEDQLVEYRDLLDVKIQLDAEIATYRNLLQVEETRLNLSSATEATPGRSFRQTPSRGTPVPRKRKRMAMDEGSALGRFGQIAQSSSNMGFSSTSSAKGSVEVDEIDTDGKFIKLYNTSEKDQAVGGWTLKLTGGNEETTFKFHRSSNVKAGQYVTVWSSDTDTVHQPPSDLVMKGQKWFTADNMKALLTSNQGEEQAAREMKRSSMRVTYTQAGDLGRGEGDAGRDDKCVIM